MFFTQEDYKKIQQWLIRNAIKDTEFNESEMPFRGNEIITLVQNGHNVKVFLKDFMTQLSLLGANDFINITETTGEKLITLEEAIQLVPYKTRKSGQVVTFIDEKNEWKVYQFTGVVNQWNTPTFWKELISSTGGSGEECNCDLGYRIYSEDDYNLFDQNAKVVVIKEDVPEVVIRQNI